ncbi:MAG: asparagine synthase (glutamine-hydrolyzing) [Armatimonadetes bacterium 13_1_40CM_64_14]|nr:MAG: asparagine synthase (glutamine-hydrolyzing) [Armatimonadetes bacterium 13_1_40CM_64_14]
MCGIVGIVNLHGGKPVDETRLTCMRDVLRHRGPDGEGLLVDGPVGLGSRRLAIVDVAGGHQPMANEDESVWVVLNGEIYNHAALRPGLQARGHRYRTSSDTETILHLYEEEGDHCVERLQGMFAFAVWDRPRQRLLLARDRLGIKPLYYAVVDQELLFASEIKAILEASSRRPALNEAILPEFLATRFIAGEDTFFRGIRKLLPGQTLSWSRADGFQTRRYWRLPAAVDDIHVPLRQAAQEVRARLAAVVKSHLMSDVPLGLFLSGGIDSSGLAALMAPMMTEPIRTFAVGFSEPDANELAYARLVARAVGAEHREVVVSPSEFFTALPQLIWHEDEPIAFPSSVPLYFVSRLARQHVKVVLTGEGADELFLGYNRYRVTAWNERLGRAYWRLVPRPLRQGIGAAVHGLPRQIRRYAERTTLALEPSPRALFFENFAVFPETLQRQLVAPALLDGRDPYGAALACYAEAPGGTLERMSHADLQTYLVELLMKQDQMSMAASIESRVPFLDHEFVEYVAAMPARFKIKGWRTKVVLREALRGLVPDPILRRRKMGFPVPVGRWFRGPFWPVVQEFVLSPRALGRGLFRPSVLSRLVEEHRAGTWDHSDRLWLLINLEIWQRVFLDGEDIAQRSSQPPVVLVR